MNWYDRARERIPAGVNSPVRAFQAVGGDPVFIRRGRGPYLWDEKDNRYIDFCGSWGALLFGHSPLGLIKTLNREMIHGTSFGTATTKEVRLAEKIHAFFPSIENVRLVSSGTEAVMSAVRLARGFTGRGKVLKIDGGYHGHVDSLLVKAGSGAATFGVPDSAGIPDALAALTLSVPFNDEAALRKVFNRDGQKIAAFVLEPVPANMGVVAPSKSYLKLARALTKKFGTVLIFDEVITGFRVSAGGAQKRYGITPDLTCLGKILGGGFPIAAFGGRKKIMEKLAPLGAVYQAGTLSGNPIAVSASLWMLSEIERTRSKSFIGAEAAKMFFSLLEKAIRKERMPVTLNYEASMFTIFFTPKPVTDFASAKKSDTLLFAKFFHECLKRGVYLSPSQFEANFISAAHSRKILKEAAGVILEALRKVLK